MSSSSSSIVNQALFEESQMTQPSEALLSRAGDEEEEGEDAASLLARELTQLQRTEITPNLRPCSPSLHEDPEPLREESSAQSAPKLVLAKSGVAVEKLWLAHHRATLEQAVSGALGKLVLEHPADPVARLCELLQQSRGLSPAAQAGDSDEWPDRGFANLLGDASPISLGAASPVASALLDGAELPLGGQFKKVKSLASCKDPTRLSTLDSEPTTDAALEEDGGVVRVMVARACAAASNAQHEVEQLGANGRPVDAKDEDSNTALMMPSRNGKDEMVAMLIEKGAPLDEKDKFGNTALMLAIKKNYKEMVALLIEKGASLDEKNKDGRTALMKASAAGDKEVVALLIEKGAPLDEKDMFGNTALMLAIKKNYKEIVALLIEKGASLDEKDKDGRTALMWAIREGHKEVVALLIEKGASLEEKDQDSRTALMWASKEGNKEAVAMMIEKGVSLDEKDREATPR